LLSDYTNRVLTQFKRGGPEPLRNVETGLETSLELPSDQPPENYLEPTADFSIALEALTDLARSGILGKEVQEEVSKSSLRSCGRV